MISIIKDESFAARNIPFGIAEVHFPERESWDENAFRVLAEEELSACRSCYPEYDRKSVFGDNPYFRFFKKFKKTYLVMLQAESVLFKGRSFPADNPVTAIPFLLELCTFVLSGTHDVDQMDGPLTLFTPGAKFPFVGLRGDKVHTYPNDICGCDNSGIILSMIAGADERTCARPDSRHVFYPVFGTTDTTDEWIHTNLERLESYIKVIAPEAVIEKTVV